MQQGELSIFHLYYTIWCKNIIYSRLNFLMQNNLLIINNCINYFGLKYGNRFKEKFYNLKNVKTRFYSCNVCHYQSSTIPFIKHFTNHLNQNEIEISMIFLNLTF